MAELQLSGKEQEKLAQVCSLARAWLYMLLEDKNVSSSEAGEEFLNWVASCDLTPQQFDSLYDRLHRTGANF